MGVRHDTVGLRTRTRRAARPVILTRRDLLRGAALATPALATSLSWRQTPALAVEQRAASASGSWRHGISLFGDLKYPPDFKQFDYVNASAPIGGMVRQAAFGTYDSFNNVIAGVKGDLAAEIELIYDPLMVLSLDEVASAYGLIAESADYPDDFSWVRFRLRPDARWHDGRPVSPDDVLFSLKAFREFHPQLAAYYRHVVSAERTGDHEVRFQFDAAGIRELPQVIGQLAVLPQHWWQGLDASGRRRDISQTTLEPPLGSGPYRIKTFEAGRFVTYERVPNYWGLDLPVNIGAGNFQELRFDYFRDPSVAFEAFQAGTVDWRVENVARNWATGYDFPAASDGRVVLEEFPIRNVGEMQAFAFNIRRPKFQDPRVRRAFNFALDFEKINQELFYGAYNRITSYFDGTELASSGLPQGRELELLEAVRSTVPPDVFTTPYWNPVNPDDEAVRANLLEAIRLLSQAGFQIKDLVLIDPHTGKQMTVEFLIGEQDFERIILFYQPALERIGINVAIRLVDDIQYVNRLREWDFDIVVASWEESLTPGNEQRDYWGSRAADIQGSRNIIGIKDAAVDALIERLIFAKTRDELVAATRALDRVLLWNHFVVPQWNFTKLRTARWNRFGHPEHMPKYGIAAFPTLWWSEENSAANK
jgi:microcin C transport system substrate-binding protein